MSLFTGTGQHVLQPQGTQSSDDEASSSDPGVRWGARRDHLHTASGLEVVGDAGAR